MTRFIYIPNYYSHSTSSLKQQQKLTRVLKEKKIAISRDELKEIPRLILFLKPYKTIIHSLVGFSL